MTSLYDWLYRTYYNLFFKTNNTLEVNLLLVFIARLLYLIAFKANYGRLGKRVARSEEAREGNRVVLTRAEIAWVIGREAGIIVFGMLAQVFGLFFICDSVGWHACAPVKPKRLGRVALLAGSHLRERVKL